MSDFAEIDTKVSSGLCQGIAVIQGQAVCVGASRALRWPSQAQGRGRTELRRRRARRDYASLPACTVRGLLYGAGIILLPQLHRNF